MAIKYAMVLRKNTRTGIKSVYAAAVNGSVDIDQVAKRIAAATTVTYPDVLAVVKALEEEIVSHLANGNAVKLSHLGSFYPTLISKGAEDTAHFSTSLIKGVRVRFRPATKLNKEIAKNAQFEVTIPKRAAAEEQRKHAETIDEEAQDSRAEAGNDEP